MCCLQKQTTLVEKSTKKNNIESETRKRLIEEKSWKWLSENKTCKCTHTHRKHYPSKTLKQIIGKSNQHCKVVEQRYISLSVIANKNGEQSKKKQTNNNNVYKHYNLTRITPCKLSSQSVPWVILGDFSNFTFLSNT